MPQLILIPYNHIYICIFILISIGLLNFYKLLTPLIAKTIKYSIKLKLKEFYISLIWMYSINAVSKTNDLLFFLIVQYLYCIDINIVRLVNFINTTNNIYLVDILLNKIS